jgi:hypothetical protein
MFIGRNATMTIKCEVQVYLKEIDKEISILE